MSGTLPQASKIDWAGCSNWSSVYSMCAHLLSEAQQKAAIAEIILQCIRSIDGQLASLDNAKSILCELYTIVTERVPPECESGPA